MTGAKDPDEYIKTRGADAFRNLLEGSEDQVDYRLGAVTAKYDLSQDDQKVAFLKEASALLATLPSAVEREVYAIRVAGQAGVGQDAVIREVERRRKQLLRKASRTEEQELNRTERMAQPADKELRYRNPVSAAAEEGVIRLLYLDPALEKEVGLPDAAVFSSEALGRIYTILRQKIEDGGTVSISSLSAVLSREEMNLLVSILQKPEVLSSGRRALQDYIMRIREQHELEAGGSELDLNALRDRLRERKGYHP